MQRVTANGVDFAYLEDGKGPLVLLMHGFPDTAHTWDAARAALAGAGFRAVSPFLRGYFPSGFAPDGKYDGDTLAADVAALIEALGEKSAIVVGHDFGALAAYTAASLYPEKVSRLVTLAIPHPVTLKLTPGLLWRGRHIPRFKLPGAVALLKRDDFALVDVLVRRWSPNWAVPAGETDEVKKSFAQPGYAEAAIAYYRQIPLTVPASLRRRIKVPTVTFAGESDGGLGDLSPFDRAASRFEAGYRWVRMPGGHWLHREDPERFATELVAAARG